MFEAHLQTELGALQYKVNDFQTPAEGGNTVSNKACGFADEGKIWNMNSWRGNVEEKKACRLSLKCDGKRAKTRFRLSAKWTSPFKLAGASVQSITGSRGVRISCSNVGYTMFRGSVKSTGYPLHSPVSPSLPLPYVTVCHHISTGL